MHVYHMELIMNSLSLKCPRKNVMLWLEFFSSVCDGFPLEISLQLSFISRFQISNRYMTLTSTEKAIFGWALNFCFLHKSEISLLFHSILIANVSSCQKVLILFLMLIKYLQHCWTNFCYVMLGKTAFMSTQKRKYGA